MKYYKNTLYELNRLELAKIGGSFWQTEGLLQQTMTLFQGPKDPSLPF